VSAAKPAQQSWVKAPEDEFTTSLLAAVDPAEAVRLLAYLDAGCQDAYRSARAAWGAEERHGRRAMAAELDTLAADAIRSASRSGLMKAREGATEFTARDDTSIQARQSWITDAETVAPIARAQAERGMSPVPYGTADGTWAADLTNLNWPDGDWAAGASRPDPSLTARGQAARGPGIYGRSGPQADLDIEWEAG
jgi:hypothetical protein